MRNMNTVATVNATETIATVREGETTMRNEMMMKNVTLEDAAAAVAELNLKEGTKAEFNKFVQTALKNPEWFMSVNPRIQDARKKMDAWMHSIVAEELKKLQEEEFIDTYENMGIKVSGKEIHNLALDDREVSIPVGRIMTNAALAEMPATPICMAAMSADSDSLNRKWAIGDLVKVDDNLGGMNTSKFKDTDIILEVTGLGERNTFQTVDVKVVAAASDEYYTAKGNLKKVTDSEVLSFTFVAATQEEADKFAAMHKKLSTGKALREFKYKSLIIKEFDDHIESSIYKDLKVRVATDEEAPKLTSVLDKLAGKTGEEGYREIIVMRNNGEFDDFELLSPASMREAVNDFKNFMLEFGVHTSPRLENTIAHKCREQGIRAGLAYLRSRYEVVDLMDYEVLKDKIQAEEMSDILKRMMWTNPDKVVNKHIELMYGPAGSGKTTKAVADAAARGYAGKEEFVPVVSLSNDMLTTDLMFVTFVDPATNELKSCKTHIALTVEGSDPDLKGEPSAVVDEVNLGSNDVMKCFQAITDNKPGIVLPGTNIRIEICESFKLWFTMNLYQDGGEIRPIPEPVADRCIDIIEYLPNIEISMSNML